MKLRDCPFCGESAEIVTGPMFGSDDSTEYSHVICKNGHQLNLLSKSPEEAVDAWNERPRKKVFLGGTCAESTWRDELIPLLKINFFNPVVHDWTPECMAEERYQRKVCDYVLYTITKEMHGVYSIAEVIDDSNKRPASTIFCLIQDGFTPAQIKSLNQVGKMVDRNGGQFFLSLKEVADFLNEE